MVRALAEKGGGPTSERNQQGYHRQGASSRLLRSSKVKDLLRGPLLFYIPRFIRHYRDRRQLGQSIGQSLKSARVRMRSYR